MSLVVEYRDTGRAGEIARLRRLFVLRAMVATGMTQREIATVRGISQAAVARQLGAASNLRDVHPETLLDAARPVLVQVAEERGFARLAVFGSVARGEARQGSDIDLLVAAPTATSSFDMVRFKRLIEEVLGQEIDLVSYGGLKPGLDDDIRRDAVPL